MIDDRQRYGTGRSPRRDTLTWIVACAAAAALLAYPVARAQEPQPAVRIEKLVLVSSPRGPVQSVAFQYDFPGREQVDLEGLGAVPARSAFRYLTLEDSLEFREPGTGRTLLSIALEDPVKMMGRHSVDLPAPTEFPPSFRSGRWERDGSFQMHVTDVLNRQFPSGYQVLQVDGWNALLTTYRLLDAVSEPLYGRVAVLVELPADTPRSAAFRVRFTSQERRSHTDWQELSSQQVRTVVEQYVSSLVRELEARAR